MQKLSWKGNNQENEKAKGEKENVKTKEKNVNLIKIKKRQKDLKSKIFEIKKKWEIVNMLFIGPVYRRYGTDVAKDETVVCVWENLRILEQVENGNLWG